MENNNLEVALVKEACPICGKLEDGPILMNTILTTKCAEEVQKLHGKTIGYMEKPCKECTDMMTQGLLIIGIVEEKSESGNPYRSGNQWVIKTEAAIKIFGEENCTKGALYLDIKAAIEIGLPLENIN